MIFDLFSYLSESWEDSNRRDRGPSNENWRFEKQPHLSEDNHSLEKILEKRITLLTDGNWVNQVPTASGLFSSYGDRRRNVDLVHKIQPGEYVFFELKVDRSDTSDTPLMAAMEVLQYGILYIFSRCNYSQQDLESKELLSSAKTVHLNVLAPYAFYDRCYNLGWLGRALDTGLKAFLVSQNVPFKMDFQYMEFQPSFNFSLDTSNEEIIQALQGIKPVPW
jgi:hypothetical protein